MHSKEGHPPPYVDYTREDDGEEQGEDVLAHNTQELPSSGSHTDNSTLSEMDVVAAEAGKDSVAHNIVSRTHPEYAGHNGYQSISYAAQTGRYQDERPLEGEAK